MPQRLLSQSVRRAYRFNQRPVSVFLAVLTPSVLPQKHSGADPVMRRTLLQEGWSALHCSLEGTVAETKPVIPLNEPKKAKPAKVVTKFG